MLQELLKGQQRATLCLIKPFSIKIGNFEVHQSSVVLCVRTQAEVGLQVYGGGTHQVLLEDCKNDLRDGGLISGIRFDRLSLGIVTNQLREGRESGLGILTIGW